MREHFYRINDTDMKLGSVIKRGFLFDLNSEMNETSWLGLKQNIKAMDVDNNYEALLDWILPIKSSKSRLVVRPTRFDKFVESLFGNDLNLKKAISSLVFTSLD
jgi:hypothetical protein